MSHGEDRHGILRSSNFELLRIFSILCVVLHHLLIDELYQCGYHSPSDGSDFIPLFINGLAIIGVNLFVLISGWFGIKSPRRSIFRIILAVVSHILEVSMRGAKTGRLILSDRVILRVFERFRIKNNLYL